MPEKKTSFVHVRVPPSWKIKFLERGINASYIARSALFQALQTSDPVLQAGSRLHSKQRAAMLYNSLSEFFVRTKFDGFDAKLAEEQVKLPYFKDFFLGKANPQEIIILGEFLEQGEYAEEILQEIYLP
jgi:hypothetical protein